MIEGKQKVNVCFNYGDLCYSTEHHVKEHGKEVAVELCKKYHVGLNHYREEAFPKLKKFLDENS